MVTAEKNPLEKLREAFPAGTVGKVPKPYKKDSPRAKCNECGGFHGVPAMHLDYVGHAAVTDRLLTVDPLWNWEPFAKDDAGLPALDRNGNLWIRLTIAGVTRIGVGDGTSLKEAIGDAIRNSAMRFGVALDLWSKEELESGHVEVRPAQREPSPKERVWAHAQGDSTDARLDWVKAAVDARGMDLNSTTDLQRLADELDGVTG